MPLLPGARRARLAAATRAPADGEAVMVVVERAQDEYVLAVAAAGGDAARVLTHVEHNLAVEGADALDPAALAALVRMEAEGAVTATQAKTLLAELVEHGGDPVAIAKAKGFEAMDDSALDAVLDEVIGAQPAEWGKYVCGDDKVAQFLTGQVMRATKGKADGKAVTAKLQERRTAASG
jgi:aspartyl-tRNA(Asn)/glutamyl-tRNA(Gln) amidotransferase subunit B